MTMATQSMEMAVIRIAILSLDGNALVEHPLAKTLAHQFAETQRSEAPKNATMATKKVVMAATAIAMSKEVGFALERLQSAHLLAAMARLLEMRDVMMGTLRREMAATKIARSRADGIAQVKPQPAVLTVEMVR